MHAITYALALAAMGAEVALAAPSHHAHLHRRNNNAMSEIKRNPQNWNDPALYTGVNWDDPAIYQNVDWATVDYGKQTPPPAAAPVTSAAKAAPPVVSSAAAAAAAPAAPVTPAAQPVENAVNNAISLLGGISEGTAFGGASASSAGSNVDEYIGNVGSPFGSNMLLITQNQASQFQYINNFTSTASSPRTWIIWNKCGPNMAPNSGQYLAPVKTITIPAGGYQIVAFAPNTQAVACDWTAQQTNPSMGGSKMCAYVEMDFANESNNGWSGYDVSNIQNVGGQCNVQVFDAASNGPVSSCTQNSYNSGNVDQGGIGGNLAPGNVRLQTTFGS